VTTTLRDFVKTRIPPVAGLVRSRSWRAFRHWRILRADSREQSQYTHFLRLPTQFEALTGPVLDHVGNGNSVGDLRIVVVGCSIGKEPYTIGSVLRSSHPNLEFHVDASDVSESAVRKARRGQYARNEVYSHELITEQFIRQTFDVDGSTYNVKPSIAEKVSFNVVDIFSPDLVANVPPADIVFAQNFLFHMKPRRASLAFDAICTLLKPRAALFIDGMDLPVRVRATKRHNLVALDYQIETIHKENQRKIDPWPWVYWGLEPFSGQRRDWRRRYATIFLNDAGSDQRV
jgi:chemotaxis methyl-accepting protein methylase